MLLNPRQRYYWLWGVLGHDGEAPKGGPGRQEWGRVGRMLPCVWQVCTIIQLCVFYCKKKKKDHPASYLHLTLYLLTGTLTATLTEMSSPRSSAALASLSQMRRLMSCWRMETKTLMACWTLMVRHILWVIVPLISQELVYYRLLLNDCCMRMYSYA